MAASHDYLTATAIVTDEFNNSVLQCWEFATPFAISTAVGTAGAATLSFDTLETVYTVIGPRYAGAVHRAPAPQLVVYLTGLAHITLPANSSSEAWVLGGSGTSLVIATDTTGGGHLTSYPSDDTTVYLQIPLGDNTIPAHTVLCDDACGGSVQFVTGSD
ncbi:MAG: hypothetical protein M1821_000219 [Bathelium mastoideum]|nr:MAG: hypothetical protein M1821_000219 [Bathelium mastoideum]KAI9687744.1 MAG: hypothetical protein M1822_001824 [Bathelium mastoideum]